MARKYRCFECGNFRSIGDLWICIDHVSKIDGRMVEVHVGNCCEVVHRARHVKGDFR